MERYTGRNEKGDLTLCGEQVYGNNQNVYNAISLLEEYEKTGLSPDEIPRWIAVGERLPDPKDMKHIQVFVIQKSTITGRPNIMSVARWNGTDWVRRGVEIARVTHWAYLPQPPKDGAK